MKEFAKEKVYAKNGRKFGPLEVHALIINKDLHGLRASDLLWNESLSDCLRDMSYEPCKIKPNVWLRDCKEHYEHVAVHADDLLKASKDL